MKKRFINILLTFGIGTILLSGCANSNALENPNTQTGAAIGAVSGAVVGGNIGDGSGANITAGALLGALAGGAIGDASTNTQPVQTGGWQ